METRLVKSPVSKPTTEKKEEKGASKRRVLSNLGTSKLLKSSETWMH